MVSELLLSQQIRNEVAELTAMDKTTREDTKK